MTYKKKFMECSLMLKNLDVHRKDMKQTSRYT